MDGLDGQDGEIKRHDPLDRLRGFRVRADRGRGVGEDCEGVLRGLERVSRDQAAIVGAWESGAPDALRKFAWVSGIKAGRLEIRVENAGARHRVDRWLRSGGLEMIRETGKVRVKSVVLVIGGRGQ